MIDDSIRSTLTRADCGGYDGVAELDMTLCIGSDAGEVGGPEGVKLVVLITETGAEPLGPTPHEESWLAPDPRWLRAPEQPASGSRATAGPVSWHPKGRCVEW